MPYVKHNAEGGIIAVSAEALEGFNKLQPEDNKAYLAFSKKLNRIKQSLASTDADFIRVLEDVVNLLVENNTIQFTNLPLEAQDRMMTRQTLRKALQKNHLNLLAEEDDKLI